MATHAKSIPPVTERVTKHKGRRVKGQGERVKGKSRFEGVKVVASNEMFVAFCVSPDPFPLTLASFLFCLDAFPLSWIT